MAPVGSVFRISPIRRAARSVIGLGQTAVEGRDPLRERPRRHGAQESDHRLLLRAGDDRPRRRSNACEPDEIAPSHPSISHSVLMPAAFTTSGQRFSSLLMKASNCCALPPTISAACASAMAVRTDGTCST